MVCMTFRTSDPGRDEQSSLHATVSFKAGVMTLAPSGPRLGEREATAISADLRPHMARHMKRLRVIVLNLTEVTMMTSFGLGMCVEIRNTASTLGVRTIVAGLRPELDEMFRMMRVDRLFTITHGAEELSKALV
jgi:anti-anti-sigma factor